jgi:hypothetical protein
MSLDKQRLEDCRFAVRRALYSRPTAALDATTIKHQLIRWGDDFTEVEIAAAASFLSGMEPAQAKQVPNGMGGVSYWQITTAGQVAYEQNA